MESLDQDHLRYEIERQMLLPVPIADGTRRDGCHEAHRQGRLSDLPTWTCLSDRDQEDKHKIQLRQANCESSMALQTSEPQPCSGQNRDTFVREEHSVFRSSCCTELTMCARRLKGAAVFKMSETWRLAQPMASRIGCGQQLPPFPPLVLVLCGDIP
jgi:hypothetical protein